MNKQELIEFLKENLKVDIWCDYDGCDSPQVNVSITLCNKEICSSRDYLLKVNQYERTQYRTKSKSL